MSLIWGLVALLAAAAATAFGVRAARRALAGGLIGEISETLTLLENHDLEAALAHCGQGGLAPSLPALPTLSYRADAGWMALLGAHLARLSASFYASAQALQDELRGLSSETAEAARTARVRSASQELQRTLALGDEALRSLRDVVSRRRCASISRS
jgi:hypothetical protein